MSKATRYLHFQNHYGPIDFKNKHPGGFMAGSYFVVDHVSDENKTDGLVESYQMVPLQYEQEDGTITTILKRMNFVHWPAIPSPFVHEEWSDDLVFSNIYTPELDGGEEDEDEEEVEEYEEDEEGEEVDEVTFDGNEDEEYTEV